MPRVINLLIISDEGLCTFYPSNGVATVFRQVPIDFAKAGKPRDFVYVPEGDNYPKWCYEVKDGINVTQVAIEGLSAVEGLTDQAKFCVKKALGGQCCVDAVFVKAGQNDVGSVHDYQLVLESVVSSV